MEAEISVEDITIKVQEDAIFPKKSIHRDHRHAIRSFRHCIKFVFCFELPDFCPVCGKDMLTTELKVPPFIYSSPFTIETTSAIALLIKPSLGKSFLYDYKDGDSLHCGILDSFGHVHDFDEKGLHFSLQRWLNCISIPVDVSLQSNKSMPTMDDVKEAWAQQCVRYDSETANCFTFVLFCLKSFGCYKHSSETDFLTEVVLPHTAKAAKYISLYRRLVSSGGTLVNSDDT